MSQTDHSKIGWNFKVARWNLAYKTASKGIKIKNYLIGYVTKTLVKKKREKPRYVDTAVNSI